MYPTKKLIIILSFMIVLFSSLYLLILYAETGISNLVNVDFSKKTGSINIDYGLNEAASWRSFVKIEKIHELHEDASSKFIRIWVDDPEYRMDSTIPYENGTYNFENLDSFINAALESSAIPLVVLAHAPKELSQEGEQVNARLPKDNQQFASYAAAIVEHYKNLCSNNQLAKSCNIDNWYWEIWNEPYWDHWWENDEYINLYNRAYAEIKKVSQKTHVGGYTLKLLTKEDKKRATSFLQKAIGMDFFSLHIYGNYPISGASDEVYINTLDNPFMRNIYEQKIIRNNKNLFFNQINSLQSLLKKYRKNEVEVLVTELGPNWNWKFEPYLDEPFVAPWYASALGWMIKSGAVHKEFYYSGTSDLEDGGFAMWSVNNLTNSITLFPVYNMKKSFVAVNIKGSTIYQAHSKNKDIEVLAISNNKGFYLTIINKNLVSVENVKLSIKGLTYSGISDIQSGKNINELNLDPYEVKFLKII